MISLLLFRKVLGLLLILAVIMVVLNLSEFGTSGVVQHHLKNITVTLDAMEERDDFHLTRDFKSYQDKYDLDARWSDDFQGKLEVHYVSLVMIDTSLPISKIRTSREADRIVVCLPRISFKPEFQERGSFIWKLETPEKKWEIFKRSTKANVDIEQKVLDAARKRIKSQLMNDGDIKQQAKESAKTFFSRLFEMLGDAPVDVKFCKKSPSPLAES